MDTNDDFKNSRPEDAMRVVPPPRITFPEEGGVFTTTSLLRGTGESNAFVQVFRQGGQVLSDETFVVNGVWETFLNASLLVGGEITLTARQRLAVEYSDWAPHVTATVVTVPGVEAPRPNSEMRRRTIFSGTGVPGAYVDIGYLVKGAETHLLKVPVEEDGSWRTTVYFPVPVTGGYTFAVSQSIDEVYSPGVLIPIRFLADPVITEPAEGSYQSTSFTLTGSNARLNDRIHIFDEENQPVGVSDLVIDDDWRCAVTVRPGIRSLVAIGKNGAEETSPGVPRSFNVRPGALTHINVTYPTDTTIKFSGEGDTGALVQITVLSGPVSPRLIMASVIDGKWEAIESWVFGRHDLSAVQKFSDIGGGWTESPPYRFFIGEN
ncbi:MULTISPECIES: hypothetical protein [Pseudomonas]|uniref:hypothetical protein n=1 Tax=Pseudomonas TaxID=286 RepID=UPI001BE80F5C|nr:MULTISPECIES: hypothetical protein [Pseudomonas]MBT2337975.1 hypothetical protein [Pseudomonas fluorescens]MCD4531439.1 hypothetical protein [Pseudomonas sp. C3-2018]